jgi:hypothetical protein
MAKRTRDEIEATAWAASFKLDSPVSYREAIELAMQPGLEVVVEQSSETGEPRWVVRVLDHPDFWMDALPSKQAALALCNAMGWTIC